MLLENNALNRVQKYIIFMGSLFPDEVIISLYPSTSSIVGNRIPFQNISI